MAVLLSLTLFVLLAATVSYFGYRQYARPGRLVDRVGVASAPDPIDIDLTGEHHGFFVTVVRNVGEKVPISPQDATLARRYLMAAGYRAERSVYTYYGAKVLLCALLLTLMLLIRGFLPDQPFVKMVLIAAGTFAGYVLPNLALEWMVKRRQERIRYSLPDALDLMVVSVEAGLGLDQALQSVSRELILAHKDICEEFQLVTLEMRAGKRRGEALKNLAARTGQPDLRELVAILVQTDKFGTSMAEALRVHSDFLRVRRRQEAEERANKVGVKLVFPIFFCVLPSMFIVTGGAAIVQIFTQLIPLMKQAAGQ